MNVFRTSIMISNGLRSNVVSNQSENTPFTVKILTQMVPQPF